MAKRQVLSGLNIFWRMILGYLVVIFLVVAISAYSILSLNKINRLANSILSIDQQVIDIEKKMTDSLLAQAQNEQKYFVTRDESYLNLYLSQQQAFAEHFSQLAPLLSSAEEIALKDRIRELFSSYSSRLPLIPSSPSSLPSPSSIDKQTSRPAATGSFSASPVAAEDSKTTIDELTSSLEKLIGLRQSMINQKMEQLRQMGNQASLITRFCRGQPGPVPDSGLLYHPQHQPAAAEDRKMTEYIGDLNFDHHLDLGVHSPRELAQLAQSFSQMADRLKEIDEMKNNFISHVSHELRTPLTSINEAGDLLLDGVGGEITSRQEHLLQIIKQCTERLIKMVNNLLDLSKMEAGMMNYEFVQASLREIILHSLQELDLLARKKSIRLEVQLEDNLPLLKMDVDRMQEVVDNLLSNAVKFTPEGGTVRIEARQVTSFLQVSVSDTGPGIPPEYQSRIFEKFQGIKSGRTSQTKGTGLGLSIASHIVKAHGGKIWVESTEGKGSTFYFSLPLTAALEKDFPGERRRNEMSRLAGPTGLTGSAGLNLKSLTCF